MSPQDPQLPGPPADPLKAGRLDDFFQSVIEGSPPLLAEILKASTGLAGGMLAVAAPPLASLVLTYRQKRAERNIARLFKELEDHKATIEDRLSKLEAAHLEEVRDRVFPALLDFVYDERDEEKVPLFAAGFCVALKTHRVPGPSVLFMQYAELLAQLSEIEVHVLSDMAPRRGGGPFQADSFPGHDGHLKKRNLTDHSFRLIQGKLHRLGLLDDDNEKKILDQIELHEKILEELASKNPRHLSSVRNLGFYSKPNNPNFEISETGNALLAFCGIQSNLE